MTLNQLICRAASTYPDAFVLEHFDLAKGELRRSVRGGDTLAHFIALELTETFDAAASDDEQIATAVTAMQRASDELAAVAHAISDLQRELLAA